MNRSRSRVLMLAAASLVGVVALACGSDGSEPTPAPKLAAATETVARATEVTATPDAPATAVPPTRTPRPYDPNGIMWRLLSKIDPFFLFGVSSPGMFLALEEIQRERDTSQVPVLIEVMRFVPAAEDQVAATLRDLTGQSFGEDRWKEWMEWLGKHRNEFQPPEEYAEWRIHILAQIHPRFSLFLRDVEEMSRIDLTELVWGGVIPDGIPDLRNPKTIPPEEADYLGPEERVFGLSINGEHRAYPLRIANAHEMVNDVLGGEPIALSW